MPCLDERSPASVLDATSSKARRHGLREARLDPTSKTGQDVCDAAVPPGMDRRTFMMRSAVVSAAAVIAGCSTPSPEQIAQTPVPAPAVPASSVSPELDVVKRAKGPVMTTLEEFYKVGPGPSSSHTIGPMRITYDFYQRATKLPADQLAKATGHQGAPLRQPERHRQGPRHRAGRAGRHRRQGTGDRRAGVPRQPGRESRSDLPGEARRQDADGISLKDIIYDAPKGNFPHPNTMTCKLMAGDTVLLRAGVLLGRRRLHRMEGL